MRKITPKEAREKYSIVTNHREMQPNGELRFALSHSDGTRYIRTERPLNAGGEWQNAHYHRSVYETYIVQCGWIAFAEDIDGVFSLRILKEGAITTIQPLRRHNVYMSAGAIVHTVKHGTGQGEDREPAPEFNEKCQAWRSESNIRSFAMRSDNALDRTEKKREYSEEYCHFDTLIWQTPGWSTAIFIGMAAVLGRLNINETENTLLGFKPSLLTTGFLFIIFIFLLLVTHTLYRFRTHQIALKTSPSIKWWQSGHLYLQAYVIFLMFVVLFLALAPIAVIALELIAIIAFEFIAIIVTAGVCLVAFFGLVIWIEYRLRRKARPATKELSPS